MTAVIAFPERTWWAFNDSKGPCGCCSHTEGFSGEDGLWTCQKGFRWYVMETEPDFSKPHSSEICPGNCREHPLLTAAILQLMRAGLNGIGWGDLIVEEEAAAEAALSESARRSKRLEEANRRAAEDALAQLAEEAAKMAAYADQKGIAGRCKNAKGKVMEPCIWLYCDESAPKNQWCRSKEGKLCAPKRMALTGSQCWAWEYMDPKTKQLKKPHTCDHIHPGEPGWLKEWNKDRTFSPAAAPAGRWTGLANVPIPVKTQPQKPAAKTSGFAALSAWDSD